ncbi:MAG TPA: tRNA (adenosine(37)-N6)-threonylcarbamoyltransferase complex dimerization subunit type 1 TsaB [Saprospiraceae bacterium]|nr:tRNA (adenosine(37)-N6)-threonylcarbamoyltransferase complex dimerization subunit type 1 TsaB [Saprospiraceae bacterium]HRX27933.1 tRNA (adenosine(37)-N6)-threonylcarbamoyltransferase complex dimerization subunit type 1 TsaB [Saprospiraceae bacterium]
MRANPYILCIDSATTKCSVALGQGIEMVAYDQDMESNSHSEKLTLLIQNVLKTVEITPKSLDAIAINGGPGSYTSLRVGASVAKAMCYALDIPLISISIHEIMKNGVGTIDEKSLLVTSVDARRMEVYVSWYNQSGDEVKNSESCILTETNVEEYDAYDKVLLAGDGAGKMLNFYNNPKFINSQIENDAKYMLVPAIQLYEQQKFENIFLYEPSYFKTPNITVAKNLIKG